jgi:hypothetical protein
VSRILVQDAVGGKDHLLAATVLIEIPFHLGSLDKPGPLLYAGSLALGHLAFSLQLSLAAGQSDGSSH